MANYYLKFGEANRLIGNRAIALKQFLKAEKIFTNLNNHNGLFAAKTYLADFYRSVHNYEKSFSLIEEAAKINEEYAIGKKMLARYYNRRAAIVAKKFNDNEEVIALSKKCIQIAKEIKEYKLLIYSYNELAYVYETQNKKKLSVAYYFKAYDIAKKLDLGVETCDVLYNISRQESLRVERSLTPSDKKNFKAYKKVRNYFIEGLKLATKINYLEKQKDFSKMLFESFFRTSQFEEAMKYNQIYYDFKHQMIEEDKRMEIAKIDASYLDKKKDDKIRGNESKIKIQYFVLTSFAILLTILFFFFIKSKKDRTNIQAQKNRIEEIVVQKTMLLKEIHHRVKNNLQLISGLLYLQVVKHKNKEVSAMVEESQKHINSIALVHEMLYKDDTLSLVSMEQYLKELGARLLQVSPQELIKYNLKVLNVSLPVDYATTLGLVLNELVTNSLKYAFTTQEGIVSVSLEELAVNEYNFIYSDNGIGCDLIEEFNEGKTLGQKLIKMLAEEIEAELTIKNEKGLTYTFKFKTKLK
ncbi:MAG: sensor histidine kinase [Flavobacteriaceae bacterium]|nr:sensor histidine kinase [Flavobacteriaceae bacterium]